MRTPVQRHIREDIRFVVVDEYQDVNPLQERLVKGLTQFGANLCVVGDDDQTIYQWRGSEVSNIVTFRDRYDGVRQVTLDDNFRSTEGVVEVGRSIAELIPTGRRPCLRRWWRAVISSTSGEMYSCLRVSGFRCRGSVDL